METRIARIQFLAQVLCGAELALAEIKREKLTDLASEGRAKRASIVVQIMHQVFEEQGYRITTRIENQDLKLSQEELNHDIYTLGEVYFHEDIPGAIVFIYNADLESEMTFEITSEVPKEIARRFDQTSYDILVSEVRTVLRLIE